MDRIGNTVTKFFNRKSKTSSVYNVNFVSDNYFSKCNEVKILRRAHCDSVLCLSHVEPGKCISGSSDKNVILYDYEEGDIKDSWRGHDKDVTKVVYESDHKLIVSGSRDKKILIWQQQNPIPVQELNEHELGITGLALCPKSGIHLCSGSRDNSVRLWDLNAGQSIAVQTVSRNLVTDIKWSPCSNFIAQTSEDKELRLWDPRNLELIDTFPKKNHIQTSCDISSDSLFCVTSSIGFASNGCEATLWDIRQRQIIHEYHGHKETIEDCIFLTSPGYLATISHDGTIKIWKQNVPEMVGNLYLEDAGTMTALVSPSSISLLVSTMKKGIQNINIISTGEKLIMKRTSQF